MMCFDHFSSIPFAIAFSRNNFICMYKVVADVKDFIETLFSACKLLPELLDRTNY